MRTQINTNEPKRILNAYAIPGLKNNVYPVIADYLHVPKKKESVNKTPEFMEAVPSVIIEQVCKRLLISKSILRSTSRKREVVVGRQIVMFILYHTTEMTLEAIGDTFNKDHATALHSARVIANLITTSDRFGLIAQELLNSYKIIRK